MHFPGGTKHPCLGLGCQRAALGAFVSLGVEPNWSDFMEDTINVLTVAHPEYDHNSQQKCHLTHDVRHFLLLDMVVTCPSLRSSIGSAFLSEERHRHWKAEVGSASIPKFLRPRHGFTSRHPPQLLGLIFVHRGTNNSLSAAPIPLCQKQHSSRVVSNRGWRSLSCG